MNFSNIFKKAAPVTQPENSPQLEQNEPSSNSKLTNETYQQWGTRRSGQANASMAALNASLDVVVCQLKKEQEDDAKLQQQLKDQINTKIANKENDLATEKSKLEDEERNLEYCKNEIAELKAEKDKTLEDTSGRQNRMAKLNLWIGGVILACITVYLMLFYSSASYSAIYGNGKDIENATQAIFDPQAWSKALDKSFWAFLLITMMPFLFMGLGFIIHQLGQKLQGVEKYGKTLTLYCITFIFDSILAYEISEKMYNEHKGFLDPPYSIPLAIQSPGFWMIIFCGFIAYIIWGLVFDYTMQSYEELDEQKMKLKNLEEKLASKKEEKQKAEGEISKLKLSIDKIKNEINSLRTGLITHTQYDYNVIKHELGNFFYGWVAYMKLVQKPDSDVQQAQSVYQSFVSTFDKTIKTTNQ